MVLGRPPIVPTGWWPSNDYTPKRPTTMAHFEPGMEVYGTPPLLAEGWWPTFADYIWRNQPAPNYQFLAWTPQTIQPPIVLGWYSSAEYVPIRPDSRHIYPTSPAFVQIPPQVLGWNPSFEVPVQPASRVHLPPFSSPSGQKPVAPPPVIVGWIVVSADFAPSALNTSYYLAPTVPVFPVLVPPPPPFTPITGLFTVSGQQVVDIFPVTGVSYQYAAITQRTD